MEPSAATHAIALIVHLLLFVDWLGGDVGVFCSSRFVVDSSRSREARLTTAKIMLDLDLIPRICMSLTLTVGAILNEYRGIEHPAWQMAALLVLYLHFREGTVAAYPWITAKLLIFAFLIFCGLMIRIRMPPFVEGLRAGDLGARAGVRRARRTAARWIGGGGSWAVGCRSEKPQHLAATAHRPPPNRQWISICRGCGCTTFCFGM